MPLLSRIYYNAVFGALGGLLGWMLFGIFGDKLASDAGEVANTFLGGALIGGIIGYFVVSVEAIRDANLLKFARLASYGVILGAIGGAAGMLVGEKANFFIGTLADNPVIGILARGIGWSLLGVAIGVSEGIAARSLGKFSYGTLGGAIGGFVGGCLFMIVYKLAPQSGSAMHLFNALGLVIMGACIGSLSALVQSVFQPASVRILRGWQEGREYPLEKPAILLGRAEHADIALFRDMKIEKKHAIIKRVGERYILMNNGAPPEFTLVNDAPLAQSIDLHDGDRIQLGNVLLRFQLRAASTRQRGRRPLPVATPASGPAMGIIVPPRR